MLIANAILCIVGGIGITNVLGFIQEYSNRGFGDRREGNESLERSKRGIMRKVKRFILVWSARDGAH